MTLTQLRTFVLVARLGSVRAAAEALAISEPAVSSAIAVLRREFGDALFVRAGNRIEITAGGRRLAARAAEIVGLAEQARREVAEVQGSGSWLRVAATSTVAEYVAAPLLAAFARRVPDLEVTLGVEPADTFADVLADRRADVTLGARPALASAGQVERVPFLRHELLVVASPRLPVARRTGPTPVASLAGQRWLAGPSGIEPATTEGTWLAQQPVVPTDIIAFPTHAAALAAARAGQGVALVVARHVRDDLRREALVRLDVPGTPVAGIWYASALGADRLPTVARRLMRFVTTPEATQAMLSGRGGVPATRYRPAVHVTLWS